MFRVRMNRIGSVAGSRMPQVASFIIRDEFGPRRHGWASASAAGVVYLVLWEIAESGREGTGFPSVVTPLFAIMIGISARWPVASLGLMVLVPALQLVGFIPPPTSTNWPTYFAIAFAGFFVAWRARRPVRYLALPVGLIAALLSAWRMVLPSGQGSYIWWAVRVPSPDWIGEAMGSYPYRVTVLLLLLIGFGVYGLFWGGGFAIAATGLDRLLGQTRRQLKQTDLELRIEQDRARISRELHDAIAHSLAVVVSQAEGALAQNEPEATERTLRNIAAVGRESLTDMRGLIERIQTDDVLEARPTVSDIPVLVDRMRQIGMDATLQVHGAAGDLTPAQQAAIYRIVQESLTNALKHGGPDAAVTVTLDWRGPGLALLVSSTGSEPLVDSDPGNQDAAGVGIAGMRERARLAGGWLTAESAEDGAFLVTAFIPARVASEAGAKELETAQ